MKPFDLVEGDRDSHVRLHVRRMFITDKAELLPHWLRFVSGVVDTEDLPLNVSREMLQTTPVLARIRKALIGRVLAELKTARQGCRRLREVLGEFRPDHEGRHVGGCRTPHRDRAAAALPFPTQDGWTSLADYVGADEGGPGHDLLPDRRRPGRVEDPRRSWKGFHAKGYEVLLMADPIDNFWPERMDSLSRTRSCAASPRRRTTSARTRTCPTSRRCWRR